MAGKAAMAEHLSRMLEHEPAEKMIREATALLASAMCIYVFTGGKDATVTALEGMIARVRAGEFPEASEHEAGHG